MNVDIDFDDDVVRSMTVRIATLEKKVRDQYQYLDTVTAENKNRIRRLEASSMAMSRHIVKLEEMLTDSLDTVVARLSSNGQ